MYSSFLLLAYFASVCSALRTWAFKASRTSSLLQENRSHGTKATTLAKFLFVNNPAPSRQWFPSRQHNHFVDRPQKTRRSNWPRPAHDEEWNDPASEEREVREWYPTLATGRELAESRLEVDRLDKAIQNSYDSGALAEAVELRSAMIEAERKDPEHVILRIQELQRQEQMKWDLERYLRLQSDIDWIKHLLPQFSLEGRWVGVDGPLTKYVIEIVYEGNTIIGKKLYSTLQENPSRIDIFRVDLSIRSDGLEPIIVPGKMPDPRMQKLYRFPAEAVAFDEVSGQYQWVGAHLVIVGDSIAIGWLPTSTTSMLKRLPNTIDNRIRDLERDRSNLQKIWDETNDEAEGLS